MQPWVISATYGIEAYYKVSGKLSIGPMLSYSKMYNDSLSNSTFKIGRENANIYLKNLCVGLACKMYVYSNGAFAPHLRFGAGVSSWEVDAMSTHSPVTVVSSEGKPRDFAATEMYLLLGIGAESYIHPHWSIDYGFDLYFLSGLGADFDGETNNIRSRGYGDINIGVAYHFGGKKKSLLERWRTDDQTQTEKKEPSQFIIREPGGGEPTDTIRQTPLDLYSDQDYDGVRDSLDLCSYTPREAAGFVDSTGCPTDSDSDGVPDYVDRCPATELSSAVDSTGCPLDSDGDGVTDDVDKCPGTPRGYKPDEHGCFDTSLIFAKRVLHVIYQPGGSDLDMRTGIYLDSLSQYLKDFPDVKVQVSGYTDNIGDDDANLRLSQKRADKIKSYLVLKGIARDRITATGRGETSFIATNADKYGREKNRRIELEFTH
jgi:outer membrane protein OmpA-like peptidoglycan-associated protein